MDSAGIGRSFGSIEHAGSFLVMNKTLDAVKTQMDGIMQMVQSVSQPQSVSLAPHLGQNVDVRV